MFYPTSVNLLLTAIMLITAINVKNLNSHNVIQFTTVSKISSLFIEFLGCCTNKSEVGINV